METELGHAFLKLCPKSLLVVALYGTSTVFDIGRQGEGRV